MDFGFYLLDKKKETINKQIRQKNHIISYELFIAFRQASYFANFLFFP